MNISSQRGSAIIMLFVAVALFGMISYAFLQGSRGNTNMIMSEKNKATATASADCSNAVNMATRRLNARGCEATQISSDVTGAVGTGPADGSCSIYHPNGGGVKACSNAGTCSIAQLNALSIGQNCSGIVYAGISPDGSKRMYTTSSDAGDMSWGINTIWDFSATGATSATSGFSNTPIIVPADANPNMAGIQPHPAAITCNDLVYGGYSDWYLPAEDELNVLYTNKSAIGGFGPQLYWSSTEDPSPVGARNIRFSNGDVGASSKYEAQGVRCVRRAQ
jgi:hypothetical protein